VHFPLQDAMTFSISDIYLRIRYAHAIRVSWPSSPLIIGPRIVIVPIAVLGPEASKRPPPVADSAQDSSDQMTQSERNGPE
jgi:hypothetical protein